MALRFVRAAFALALVLSFGAKAQSITAEQEKMEAEALKDCSANQSAMNLCAHHEFRTTDAELNRLYRELMSRFANSPTRARLQAAQRAWLNYVDADCLYQNGHLKGGSMYAMSMAYCRAGHMKQRIAYLKSYVECTQNGCPE